MGIPTFKTVVEPVINGIPEGLEEITTPGKTSTILGLQLDKSLPTRVFSEQESADVMEIINAVKNKQIVEVTQEKVI